MNRYHKDIRFPEAYQQRLKELTEKFNSPKRFGRTNHAFDRLRERFNYLGILNFLANNVRFDVEDIFEFYADDKRVDRVCYKLNYDESQDLIIILTANKDIVTLYTNSKGDNHKTLKRELYTTV